MLRPFLQAPGAFNGFLFTKETKDMGSGTFAAKDIIKGTCILKEEIIVLPNFAKESTTFTQLELLQLKHGLGVLLRLKGKEYTREFLALENKYRGKWGPFLGTFASNKLLLEGGESLGLGIAMAGFNHACISNVQHTARSTNEQPSRSYVTLYAVKDIKAGEEITIQYIEMTIPTLQRRLALWQTFNFSCVCVSCMVARHGHQEDDETFVAMFHSIRQSSKRDIMLQKPEMVLKWSYDLIAAYKNLGVADVRITRVWEHCARLTELHGDLGRATQFILEAGELRADQQGRDGPEFQGLVHFLQNRELLGQKAVTQRGKSKPEESWKFMAAGRDGMEILFMRDVEEGGAYKRLVEYDVEDLEDEEERFLRKHGIQGYEEGYYVQENEEEKGVKAYEKDDESDTDSEDEGEGAAGEGNAGEGDGGEGPSGGKKRNRKRGKKGKKGKGKKGKGKK